jgi:cytochrome c oxidase assembly protein subunit 23
MANEEENKKAWEKGGAKFNRYVIVALTLLPTSTKKLTQHPRQSKSYSEYFDPCQEAADRSLRCLRRNGGDKTLCSDYFEYESFILTLCLLIS